jgi:hypothetical protein
MMQDPFGKYRGSDDAAFRVMDDESCGMTHRQVACQYSFPQSGQTIIQFVGESPLISALTLSSTGRQKSPAQVLPLGDCFDGQDRSLHGSPGRQHL